MDLTTWQAAEAELTPDNAALSYELVRLLEGVAATGQGTTARLAQAEAASLSQWIGDHISADCFAHWLSWRIRWKAMMVARCSALP